MALFLHYRTDKYKSNGLTGNNAKNSPLSNEEIDSNFRSIQLEMENKANVKDAQFTGITYFSKDGDGGGSAIVMPQGTQDQRPKNPVDGMIRYNTTNKAFEGYRNGGWGDIGEGAVGGGTDRIFYICDTKMTSNFAIPEGKNALTVGPLNIGEYEITMQGDSRLVVL